VISAPAAASTAEAGGEAIWDEYMKNRDPTLSPTVTSKRKSSANLEDAVKKALKLEADAVLSEPEVEPKKNERKLSSDDAWDQIMSNRIPEKPPTSKRSKSQEKRTPKTSISEPTNTSTNPIWNEIRQTTPEPEEAKRSPLQTESKTESKDVGGENLNTEAVWDSYMNNRQDSGPKIVSKRKSALLLKSKGPFIDPQEAAELKATVEDLVKEKEEVVESAPEVSKTTEETATKESAETQTAAETEATNKIEE